jgi:uncharacterized protein (TIGR02145 family)
LAPNGANTRQLPYSQRVGGEKQSGNEELKMEKGTFTDDRDDKSYKWVKIGQQYWMAENLNYNAVGSKCYENSDANCEKYGRLYNWQTAMKACPKGWHLPNNNEWQTLVDFASDGDIAVAGKKLKARRGWADNSGTDEFEFAALPGGYGNSSGLERVGYHGYWWSSAEDNAADAYYWYMFYKINLDPDSKLDVDPDVLGWALYNKAYYLSVRCVKD